MQRTLIYSDDTQIKYLDNGLDIYFHRFGVARLANKTIRCPVKFEFEINSELFLV